MALVRQKLTDSINENEVFTPKIEALNDSLLNRKLAIILKAANHARNSIKYSSTHPSTSADIYAHILVERSRDDAGRQIDSLKQRDAQCLWSSKFTVFANVIINNRAGNCGEASYLVASILFQHDMHVEVYNIKNGNHTILVIDRDQTSNKEDYKKWGDKTIICDTFAGSIYLVSEIEEKLIALESNKIVQFNPKTHSLEFRYTLESFAEYKTWANNNIKMYKKPIMDYLHKSLSNPNMSGLRKKQYQDCLDAINDEFDQVKITVALKNLKELLYIHQDKGLIGLLKANWFRNTASYNEFCKVFGDFFQVKNQPDDIYLANHIISI